MPAQRPAWLYPILAVTLASVLAVGLDGGIWIGSENHVGLLPVVRRLVDPAYLPGDFGIELRLHHHQTWTQLVALLSRFLGETRALALLTWTGVLLVFTGLWRLARVAGLSRGATTLVCTLLATGGLFMNHGLEINRFLGNGPIMPPTYADAFVLLSLAAVLGGGWIAALGWAGAALLFHLQVGITWILVLAVLAWRDRDRLTGHAIGLGGLLFLILAAPAVINLVTLLGEGAASAAYTLTDVDFRNAHHFRLRSTSNALKILAHFAALWGVYRLFTRRGEHNAAALGQLAWTAAALLLLAGLHFLDYYVVRDGTVARLQTLRLSPLIPLLGGIALAAWLQRFLTRWRSGSVAEILMLTLALAVTAGKVVQAQRSDEPFDLHVHHYADAAGAWTEVTRWVRDSGPRQGLFVTPPGHVGFTVLSDRSTLVEYKINPDGGRGLAEWYARLRAVTGDRLPTTDDRGNNAAALDAGYANLPAEGFGELVRRYGARYAVVPLASAAPGRELYRNTAYRVVELPPISAE